MINAEYNELSNSCAVIYGKLPPEIRREQARKFNDKDLNFKYLIATNAIGMGVNLKIRRIIFQTLTRMGSEGELVRIDDNEIRQIAGRAGRYTENGYVACMKPADLKVVKKALKNVNSKVRKDTTVHGVVEINTITQLKTEENGEELIEIEEKEEEFVFVEEEEETEDDLDEDELIARSFSVEERDIEKAAIFPQFQQIEAFSKELELFENSKSTLSDIFRKFVSIAQIEGNYFIQRFDNFCYIADMIEKVQLTRKDQYIFSSAPLNLNEKWKKARKTLKDFAEQFG